MKTILFDGAVLRAAPVGGVAQAFLTALRAYATLTDRECVLVTHPETPFDGGSLPGIRILPILTGRRLRRGHCLRVAQRQTAAALLHLPVAATPFFFPRPVVATVHDVPWLLPELRDEPGSRRTHRLALQFAARRADAIIVPSDHTAVALRQVTWRERSVHVIGHGVDPVAVPSVEAEQTGSFLVLADARPRKNLERIGRAHARAQALCPDLPGLRRVGPGPDAVPEAEKWRLLRGARALLQLSLHEGFGLPILEAFAHGVPVLCSDASCLPEVAAGAALLADPRNEASMAAAMVRIHRDTGLRARLRAAGRRQAASRTAAATALAWDRLHRELIG